jgi:hypothetical protein
MDDCPKKRRRVAIDGTTDDRDDGDILDDVMEQWT